MSHFSGAVKLADLDDYLAPSQNCIKPVMKRKDEKKEEESSGDGKKKKVKNTMHSTLYFAV